MPKYKKKSIFAIDFSGAFDNVTYKAIIDALYRRGFGKNFTTNVATLLTNNRSRIMVNGKYINSINIEKSCRQGDPISPYLFIIVLDQLLDKINYAKSLKGYELKFGKRKIKIKSAAFADDCYTFLTGNKKEIKHQFETVKKLLKTFEADTGLKINVAKSELTLSGPIAKEAELNMVGIVSKKKIKMLGVNIGEGSNISEDVINTLSAKMKFWEKFHYNEVDRIEILNAFVIPSVIHMLRHVPFNRSMEVRLSKMASDFIWGKRRRYISKDILFQNIKSGGMGALPIGKVWLKVILSWLMRALNPESRAQVMEVAGEKYEKKYGHKISSFLCHGVVAGKRMKVTKSVLESAFEVGRKIWSDYLDNEPYENQPLLGNKRILRDTATTTIDALNLPAFDETTIPTTAWLEMEVERINNKPTKTLTEILTAHLKNRLDPRRKPERTALVNPKKETLRKFKRFSASSMLGIIKLKTDAAEERILNTAKKYLEEGNPILVEFEENFKKEIKSRNQTRNHHLDNRLLRIRHKIKYNSLLTNEKLKEWKILESEACSFCGTVEENIDHLLNDCEILKPLWDKIRERTRRSWRVKPNLLDRLIGMRRESNGESKAEKLFLKALWRTWGIKHGEECQVKRKAAIERLTNPIDSYAEIMNFDTYD